MLASRCAPAAVYATLAALLSGCIRSSLVDCNDGTACAPGRVCAYLKNPDATTCVGPDQLTVCDGHPDGDECTVKEAPPSSCQSGVCLPIVCGNGRVDRGEICDDANIVTGDGCAADCRSDETCGNGIVDPLRLVGGSGMTSEQCDDGNRRSNDGCSSTCLSEALVWEPIGEPIGPLAGAAMAYDSLRQRIVLFGGTYNDAMSNQLFSDVTYEWDRSRWRRIRSGISPSARQDHEMAYDASRRRVVMFGGRTGDFSAPFGDTWEWDGAIWSHPLPTVRPAPRSKFGMAYDAAHHRTILFGGYDGTTHRNDTWAWDGMSWTQLQTSSAPSPRQQFAMAYDPSRAVIVLVGGVGPGASSATRDTWELQDTTWTRTDTASPDVLDLDAVIAFDRVGGHMIAATGFRNDATASTTTFAYTGSGWVALAVTSPDSRIGAAMAADPKGGEVILMGGWLAGVTPDDKTWRWNGSAWAQAAAPVVPKSEIFASTATDRLRGVTWMLGGQDLAGTPNGNLYAFDGASWRDYGATGPSPRSLPSVVYDPERSRLVVFGGLDGSNVTLGDTWLWDGATWTQPTPSTSPIARVGASFTYDPRRKVCVLFGGIHVEPGPTPSQYLSDTWEWDGNGWTKVSPPTEPAPRAPEAAYYDGARHAVVIYGGFDGTPFDDMWSYDGSGWTQIATSTPLVARFYSPFAYDPAAGHAVLFGGRTFGGSDFSDTWSWDATGWHEESAATHPTARGRHILAPSPDGVGVFLYGGAAGDNLMSPPDRAWSLSYQNDQPRELCGAVVDNDGDGLSGCADPDCWTRCTPFCEPGSTCDLAAPRCGDGVCSANEDCHMCPQDCACVAVCGDGFCDSPETMASCPGDCTP